MAFLFRRNQGEGVQALSVSDYKATYVDGKRDHVLVDVRTPGEFSNGHLPGAINLPLNELGSKTNKIKKGKPVVVVCASGSRSRAGARMLLKAGFSDVYNLKGGTSAWMMQKLPLE